MLVDGSDRLGPLSYRVPDGMSVSVGDAVCVPYGKQIRYGMVVGEATNTTVTLRDIIEAYGRRADPTDVAVSSALAARHFAPEQQMLKRCAPTSAKGAPPLSAGSVALHADPGIELHGDVGAPRLFVTRHPSLSPAALAAHAVTTALGTDPTGQVLVLCPTVALVDDVLAEFQSGAARLDSAAARGAWRGFVDGVVQVGVGTRSAMMYSAARLTAIVVVEHDHVGHVAQRQPYTSSTEVAIARCEALGARLFVTGLCPSANVLAHTKLVEARPAGTPPLDVVLHTRKTGEARRMFPAPVRVLIERAARAGKSVVIASRDSSVQRCTTCRDRWVVGAVQCQRCGNTTFQTSGWNAERVATMFSGNVRAVSLEQLSKIRNADLLVLADTDVALQRASLTPELDWALHVLHAAESLAPDGELMLLSDLQATPLVYSALLSGSMRNVARVVWAQARDAALPPFSAMVELRLKGRKSAPATGHLPGRVLGPRRLGPDEFSVVVLLPTSELELIAPVVAQWRSRGQLRVTVTV